MVYDFDDDLEHRTPRVPSVQWAPNDLEVIVTMLDLAAIFLTPAPDTKFTFEQLVQQIRELGGNEIRLEERDIRIVLQNTRSLKKWPKKLYSLR